MNKEPTVAVKLAAFAAKRIDEATVRANVDLKSIRTETKLAEAVTALVAKLKADRQAARAAKQTAAKQTAANGEKVVKLRGFRYGPVWLKSVAAGKGIAVRPANSKKLVETAQHFGVDITGLTEATAIAAKIAPVIPADQLAA